MNERLIRAAIALYPPEWRRRYGGEVEQVTVEAYDASTNYRERARLVLGLAVCGLRARTGTRLGRHGIRIIGVLATTAAALAAVMVFFVGNETSAVPLISPTPDSLAPGAHIDPRLKETHEVPTISAKRPEIVLGPGSGSRNILAVVGAHVSVRLDPRTEQVTSIQAKKR